MKTLGKPESNSDVLNKHPTTLLIGIGWVGQFIGKYFTEAHYVTESGIFRKVSDNEEVEPLENYTLAFINVPTPMLPSGQCDTSIVEGVVKQYAPIVEHFCCKSTIEIGTCDKLYLRDGISICMSPEYVGETLGHPLLEPSRETFVILGGPKKTTRVFAEAWTLVTNARTKIYQTNARTAELCKLMENSFIATKVMFCNEFFDLAEQIGADYNELRELFLADPRMSRDFTYVYRNNRGFSGKCLPKDLNNLTYFYRHLQGQNAPLIEFLLKRNAELRKDYKNSVPLLGDELNERPKKTVGKTSKRKS
jgi:UDPglucose 6-dehydrogenase